MRAIFFALTGVCVQLVLSRCARVFDFSFGARNWFWLCVFGACVQLVLVLMRACVQRAIVFGVCVQSVLVLVRACNKLWCTCHTSPDARVQLVLVRVYN